MVGQDYPNGPLGSWRSALVPAAAGSSLGDSLGHLQVVKYAHEHVAPENLVYKIDSVLA